MTGFSISGRIKSIGYALQGIAVLLHSQHNAWIHLGATLAVIAAAAALRINAWEWLALVVAITMVWVAEAFNTALELVCDMAIPDFHPLIKKAKDVSAGAVLLSACGAMVIGGIVFVPHVLKLAAP